MSGGVRETFLFYGSFLSLSGYYASNPINQLEIASSRSVGLLANPIYDLKCEQ